MDNIDDSLRKEGLRPSRIEGYTPGRWILMDYGDVIAHILEEEARNHYNIEKLWLDAPRVDIEDKEKV